jgi:dihydroneopterin aldolase
MKNYKILIEDFSFYAILGMLEEERNQKQLIIIDCEIEYENKEKFINYAEVVDLMEKIIQNGKFELIEDALDKIEEELLKRYPHMKTLFLRIKKPEILKNALVGAEILRKY